MLTCENPLTTTPFYMCSILADPPSVQWQMEAYQCCSS